MLSSLPSPISRRQSRPLSATKRSAPSHASSSPPPSPSSSCPPSGLYLRPQITSSSPPDKKHFSSRSNTTASRIFTSVRRSLSAYSSKKRHIESSKTGFYSPFEDRYQRFAFTPSHFRFQDDYATRPTVEQIAMGLHLSRTPHLRPVGRHHSPPSQTSHLPRDSVPPRVRPPPPTRSSLKKPSTLTTSSTLSPATTPVLSAASMSTTTLTSVTPSIAKSTGPVLSLKARMSKIFPGTRPPSIPHPELNSPLEDPSDSPQRKAVRFSGSTPGLVENTY